MVTFFNFLSDLGSTTSLLHFFHRAGREGSAFEPYFAPCSPCAAWRSWLGAAAVAIAFPLAAAAKGFAWGEIALVTAGILACVWFQIQSSIRILALRLYGPIRTVVPRRGRRHAAAAPGRRRHGGHQPARGLARRRGLGLGLRVEHGALARSARPAGAPTGDLRPYRRQILRYMLPTLPSALYFSVQGPLLVWLSATFGTTRTLAEVGALGRLGLIVGMFSGLTGVVFLPRLAAITSDGLYRAAASSSGSRSLSSWPACWPPPRWCPGCS